VAYYQGPILRQRSLPGALGAPADPQALIDHRYLWSTGGHLLLSQQRAGSGAGSGVDAVAALNESPSQTAYAYNARGQLVAGVRSSGPGLGADMGAQAGQAKLSPAGTASAASQQASAPQAEPLQELAVWRYAFDASQRRILSQQGAENQADLASGTQRSQFQDGSHRLQSMAGVGMAGFGESAYNANGQPERLGQREYVWDALGRLVEVREKTKPLARYQYDHRGLRISKTVGSAVNKGAQNTEFTQFTLYDESRQPLAELNGQGQIQRQYIWLADLPLAVIDTPQGKALGVQRNALQQVWADMQQITAGWLGSGSGTVWLHTNHLGAPEAATDAAGQVVWRASYAPFGAATVIAASTSASTKDGVTGAAFGAVFQLNLRLPGQIFDPETGLHHNRQRYYDPQHGQYLTPDPLGTPDGPNPYAYVAFNPLTNIDPDGLILFAFDGSGNTESSRTNVYWIGQAYQDNDLTKDANDRYLANSNRPFYIEGPGTGQLGDGALAYSLKGRIDTQLNRLDEYVKAKWQNEVDVKKHEFNQRDPLIITLDVVGFSRGAAAARDFANQVINRKNSNYYNKSLFGFSQTDSRYNCVGITLRFMGLFDSALSTAIGGTFNLSVSDSQIEYVAQAVAVNEHRAMFPLESIDESHGSGGFNPSRVEMGFIGAHSDIGGGYAGAGGDGGDLSDVALNWMYAQAKTAGVNMKSLETKQLTVANPVLHDESRVAPWTLPGLGGLSSDREMRFKTSVVNMKNAQIEGMSYKQSKDGGYIQYNPPTTVVNSETGVVTQVSCCGNRAGVVDMTKYRKWLQDNLSLTLQ
jgi:RHS repeat-associated protein